MIQRVGGNRIHRSLFSKHIDDSLRFRTRASLIAVGEYPPRLSFYVG